MSEEILPCKKHGIKPHWVEDPIDPTSNLSWPRIKRRRLVCGQCEIESEAAKNDPYIKEWNEKQK